METILLLDDDPAFLEAARYALGRRGAPVRIETASSAEYALRLLATQPFDAIVTDFGMPGLNGIDFLKECRTVAPDIPVLVLTGYPVETLEADAAAHGAYATLQKPIDADVLYSAIRRGILRSRVFRRAALTPAEIDGRDLSAQQGRLSEQIKRLTQRLQDTLPKQDSSC